MEINGINHNNTSFGARIRVKEKDIDRVMSTITECDNYNLGRIYKTLKDGEFGIGNGDIVFIKPIANGNTKKNHRLLANINTNDYTNDIAGTFSYWSLPHFFEKLLRISREKYYTKSENLQNRVNELDQRLCLIFESLSQKKKVGSKEPSDKRDHVIDAILSILTKKDYL